MRRYRRLALAAALVVLSLPGDASASPPDTLGVGSRSIAMGGAVVADVEDFGSVYYNPAGLARDNRLQVNAGYLRLHSHLSINDRSSDVEPLGSSMFGIVASHSLGRVDLAFGLAVLLNDQRIARTRTAILDRPRWELYDTRDHKIYLAPAVGIRPFRWLHIGGGVTFQSPATLSLDVRGSLDPFNTANTRFEHRFRGNLVSVRYAQAGFQIDPNEDWSIGASYRGSFKIETVTLAGADLGISLFPGLPPIAQLQLAVASISLSTFGPQQATMGVAYHPSEAFRIGADLVWVDWSGHGSLISDEEISLALEGGDSLGIEFPSEIRGRDPIALNLRDQWVPRVGGEGRAFARDGVRLFVRGGYSYERTPFPEQTGVTNFVDGDRHTVSSGLGLVLDQLEPGLDGELRIDMHLLWGILPDRLHRKTSLVDPVGDYVAGGHQLGFGLNVGVVFE
jgi:long-chain fatty acid transport protein